MERYCKNTTKSFIIDVWYGCKYTPEVVHCKIYLKWMNAKMLEKAFLQCGPCRRYPYAEISQDIRSSSWHMYYHIVVLKNLAKPTGMHLHRSLFSIRNLQLHRKRDAGMYRFWWLLRNYLGTLLSWRTNIFIIMKIYREIHSSFKKQTLLETMYPREPLIESWHWT